MNIKRGRPLFYRIASDGGRNLTLIFINQQFLRAIVYYNIVFDSKSRLMENTGQSDSDDDEDESYIIRAVFVDSGGLLTGYTPYAIFDGTVRREIVDGEVEIPVDVLIGDKIRFQLMFTKDSLRFYSLNILSFRLNKVISR